MLLAIDAGNTNTVFAVFEDEKLLGQWRMATDARRTADEYGVWLLQLMGRAGIDPKRIKHAIVSSVVPQTLFALKSLSYNYFGTELLVVGDPKVKTGISARIERANEVGADRLVNALAARMRYGTPLIIVDFGTATTFDIVDDAGDYVGGIIAPGVNLSLEALHKAAAKLPNVAVEKPAKVIGTSTVSAMQSGIFWGYVSMIEGIATRIRAEYGKPMKLIATGGLSSLFGRGTNIIDHQDPDLTIMGLKAIFELNR